MTPHAVVASTSPGRTRFKVPARSRSQAYFRAVTTALRSLPGVGRIVANPVTASILVSHDIDLADIIAYAEREGLFVLRHEPLKELRPQPGAFTGQPLSGQVAARFAGVTMLGLAAYQARRGKFLPAGMTLVFQALELLSPGLRGQAASH